MPQQNVEVVGRASLAVRRRYEGSWVQGLTERLTALEFGNRIILFGASLLLTVLPSSSC